MQMAEGIVYKQVESWYGGDNRALELNVIRRPGEGPRPLIIWLTGGAWSQVSKDVHVPEVVYLVEGSEENLKITTPVDLVVAAAILQERWGRA